MYTANKAGAFSFEILGTHTPKKKEKKKKKETPVPVTDGPVPQASTRPFLCKYTDTRNTADCRCKDPKTESIGPVS